jgi:hypothetical protein
MVKKAIATDSLKRPGSRKAIGHGEEEIDRQIHSDDDA